MNCDQDDILIKWFEDHTVLPLVRCVPLKIQRENIKIKIILSTLNISMN